MDPLNQTPQNTNPVNSTQNPLNNMPLTPTEKAPTGNGHRKVGPIIASVVVVLVLIAAALYVFASHVNQQPTPTDSVATTNTQTVTTVTSAQTATQDQTSQNAVPTVSNTSDDVQSLQNDLNSSTDGVDSQSI